MTTTDPAPASMGGPLSEAERIADIRRGLKMAKLASANAPGTFWHSFTENAEFLLELVGVLEGQLAKAADPVNGPVQLAIHRAVCEESLAHCSEYRGRCVRSAEAAAWALGLDGGGSDA